MRHPLHRLLLLLLPLSMALGTRAQTTLVTESFATEGEGVRYTSNAATIAAQQYLDPGILGITSGFTNLHYFMRSDFNPPRYPNDAAGGVVFGTSGSPRTIYDPGTTTPAAPGFWACEGVRGSGGPGLTPQTDPGNVTLNAVTVTNYTGLQVRVKLADPRSALPVATSEDIIRIQYSMDGGAWTTVGLFRGDTPTRFWTSADPATSTVYPSTDARYRTLDRAFQAFTYNIGTIGTSLRVRVEVDQFGSSQEIAFDDLAVLGTVSSVTPPSLTNINPGNTDVTYTEAQPNPVQLTSSILASYATNLTGATVQFSAGFRTGQDVLNFTNQNGISGIYNTGTGVLALSGASSAANYQTALRSITYSNSNTMNATGGRRTVSFSVADGANASAAQTRDVVVTAILAGPAAMPYTEDFTTDGEGTRYATNTFNIPGAGAGGLGWFRTNVNPMPGYTTATFSNISNGYYWYGEGTKNFTNPDPALIGFLETQTIDATNYRNLHYQVRLAQGLAGQWETDDYVKFYYRVGAGSWVLFGAFYGNAGTGDLQRDTDLNGVADGTVLTNALTNIDFVLPATLSGIIDFRTVQGSTGAEELAMDLIQVTGTPVTTVTSIVPAAANPTNASSVTYTVTFASSITGLSATNFSLTSTGAVAGASVTSLTGSGTTYTVTVNTGTGTGTLRLNLANDTGLSLGISNSPYTSGTAYTIDKTAPTVAITSSTAASGNSTSATPFAYTATFSEAVTGFVAGDVTVGNGTISGFSGSGTTYTFNVTPGALGAVTVTVPANVAQDGVGNFNTAGTPAPYSITFVAPTITVAPATLPNGTVASAYSQTISASGGTAPYSFARTAGALPAGLTLSSAGVLSGTPTAGGSFSFTVTATDASTGAGPYTGSRNYTLTIGAPTIAVAPATLPNGATGTAYNQTITGSGGTAPYSFAITAGALPAGLSLASNGTLAGTPTAGGSFTFTVAATDASTGSGPYTGSRAYTLSIVSTLAATAQNVSVQLNANGTATLNATSVNNGSTGAGTLTYTIQKIALGRLAEGQTLTLSTANGANFTQIRFASYGTPGDDGRGNYSFGSCNAANSVATAQNSFIGRSSGIMNAANGPGAANNNPQLGDPCGGTPKFLAVQAGYSANAASLSYACSEASQTNYVLLTVTDGGGNTSTSVAQVTVVAPPTASFTLNPTSGNSGATITASGSSLSGATALTVNGATATISSLTAGGFTFVVPAGATVGAGSVVLTTPCSQAPSAAFTVTQPTTAAPVVTAPANSSLLNTATPTFSGTAPTGSTVTVYVDGTAIGTTTAAGGNFSLTQPTALAQGSHTVLATAQTSGSAVSANSNTSTFIIDTVRPTVAISSTAGATGSTTGTSPIPFTVTFSEAVTGFVAGDITVNNGSISGFAGSGMTYAFNVTPTTAGTATTVNVPANVAQDAASNFNTAAPAAYSLTFLATSFTISPATLPAGTVGTAYSQTLTASGGTAPYSYAITAGALPAGLSLSSAGVVSGTPTVGGSFSFTVTATDASAAPGPYTGSRAYSLTIGSQPITAAPVITLPANNTFTNGVVTISGTAPANSTVVLYLSQNGGAVTSATVMADASGVFTTGALPFPEATYQIYGTAQSAGASLSANSATITFTVDQTRPTVTLSSSSASGSTNVAAPFAFTATFSENVTGFVAGDLVVTNGTVSAFAGSGTSYTFTVTPTTLGTVSTVAVAVNSSQDAAGNGNVGSTIYSLTSSAPTVTIAPASLPGGTVAAAYSQTLSASGGTAPYSYAITAGALPSGLSLSSGGVLAGTPTTGGSFSFTVTATDASTGAGPYTGSRAYSLTIAAPASTSWTGLVSTDWFTAGNWTAGVPTTTVDALVPVVASNRYPTVAAGTANVKGLTLNAGTTLTQTGGTLNMTANLTNNGTLTATGGTVALGSTTLASILGSGNTRFWSLTVGAGGAQSSTSASTSVQQLFTLNGNFATNGNPLTLESNATATALVVNNGSNVIVGTVAMQRYLDPSLNAGVGYRHYSSPVASTTVADLSTSTFAPVVNPAYNTLGNTVTPFPTVYGYDESRLNATNATTRNFDYGYFSPGSLTDALVRGRGYAVNIDAASKVDLVGTLNNGSVGVGALSRGTEANAGWHLLGNPYPAPLDWNVARTGLPTGVIDAVYVFKSSSQYAGTYQFYQNGFGTLPGGLIASMQGFFVRVSQPVAAFSFQNAWRSTTYQNPTFNRTTADTRPAVQLELVDAQGTRDAAFVYFEQGATAGLDDHYDATKLPNTTGLNLASVAMGQNLAVNGLPLLGTAPVTVPLFIGLPATGTYTLHTAQLLNFGAGAQPWLRDLQLNTLTDLSLTPDYAFTMNAANPAPRFELVFGPAQVLSTSAALAAQVAVFPNPARAAVAVELPGTLSRQPVTAALVDALGRVVVQQVLPAGLSTHKLSLANVATGVYTLRLSTSAGIIVKKLIVE